VASPLRRIHGCHGLGLVASTTSLADHLRFGRTNANQPKDSSASLAGSGVQMYAEADLYPSSSP